MQLIMQEQVLRLYTIGHQILDLEAGLGVSTEPHKETLDTLIEEARRAIQVKGAYTREDAVGILRTIDSILQNSGFERRDTNGVIDGYHLFHEGLGSKKIDCDNRSFIYLSIAEALRLPLAAVHAPEHLFLRFMLDDGSCINWETTSAAVRSDGYYKSWLNIADAAIENGVFLKNLTRDGVIASAYNDRGNAWADKGNVDKGIADFNEAIRLYPNYAAAYNNRGNAWYNKGNLDEAIADFNEAIRLDPNNAVAYNNRGNAWTRKGNLDEAIADYNTAIRLNPKYVSVYSNRGVAWFCKGNLIRATLDFIRYKVPLLRG